MKQLLIYTAIFDDTAAEFIEAMSEIPQEEDIKIRMNCPGGSVFAGWGMIADVKARKNLTIQVDGMAASMAFYMCLFADNVEALDISTFMIHRADGWVDTPEEKALLDGMNSELRAKMESRIDSAIFESITGTSIDALFNAKERKDVYLTAEQAKSIGLVNKITRLETKEQKAMSKMVANSEFAEKLGFVAEDKEAIFSDWDFEELSKTIK